MKIWNGVLIKIAMFLYEEFAVCEKKLKIKYEEKLRRQIHMKNCHGVYIKIVMFFMNKKIAMADSYQKVPCSMANLFHFTKFALLHKIELPWSGETIAM